MRPSFLLFTLLILLILGDSVLLVLHRNRNRQFVAILPSQQMLVSRLGLSDLALSTEARYTRHPAVTDPIAPFMDHPGAIEHFPSGSFLLPVKEEQRRYLP
jgi:hypothetical protein